jgi:hypothetical protein
MVVLRTLQLIQSLFFLGLLLGIGRSQEADVPLNSRLVLTKTGCLFSYPHGFLDHGSFYGTVSTRYLILKASQQSDIIANAFMLTQDQRIEIGRLVPVAQELAPIDLPDEQVGEPTYFDFLEPHQIERLDQLAMRFDGFASLLRVSMSKRLDLSPRSQKEIVSIINRHRKTVVAPLLQNQIAEVRKPKDYDFRTCLWSGQFGAVVNIEILDALQDDECDRLVAFTNGVNELHEAIQAIEDLAPLPKGLLEIHGALDDR